MWWMLLVAAYVATSAWVDTACAQAPGDGGKVSLALTAGTLGIGPEVGYRFNQRIGVRANGGFFGLDHDFSADGIDYRGHAQLSSGAVIIDVYPFGGGFRLSGGVRYNGSEARVRATPIGPTQIGDLVYTPAEIGTITGHADVRSFAPQWTIGYGGQARERLSFNIEAGVLFQGAVRVRELNSNGTLAGDARYLADLDKQRGKLQSHADDYPVYPILQLGLKYRF